MSRLAHFLKCLLLSATIAVTMLFHGPAFATDYGLVIQNDADGLPGVSVIPWPPTETVLSSRGLLVWSDGKNEQWIALPAEQVPGKTAGLNGFQRVAASASRGPDAASPVIVSSATLQLDQLMGQLVIRGAGFITPVAGEADLDGKITIRRRAESKGPEPFPADEFILAQNGKPIATLKCGEGIEELAWSKLTDLPPELRERLPEGEYSLRAVSGGESAAFQVESEEIRDWIWEPLERLREYSPEVDSLFVQIAVEHLLDQRDEVGHPTPYVSDALDLIAELSTEQRTAHLQAVMANLQDRLAGTYQKIPEPDPSPTGLTAIDQARNALQDGHWSDAQEMLVALDPGDDSRIAGLRALYRAVILAEYGQATGDAAESLFQESLLLLDESAPADRLRAHNNYANFLLNRAQDRVYNHAFQVATGTADPLLTALVDWRTARDEYQAAIALAEANDTTAVIDIRVNQARLYVLLADLLRTLNSTVGQESAFTQAEDSAASEAIKLAMSVLDQGARLTPRVRGIVNELLAHLDYRGGQFKECRRHTDLAMTEYLAAGTLTGVESAHRLLGLIDLRDTDANVTRQEASQTALRHFQLSNFLAEFLRSRIPNDQIGLSMAGYLARRTYVNEQIIGLLIAEGRHAEALEVAEAGKSQALQQVLRQQIETADPTDNYRSVPEMLADWPANTTALEYMLGSERGWVFVICGGKVTAYELMNRDGTPLASREIVARVQQLLSNMNAAARKMFQRRRFDHDWQTELHALYQILIPNDARHDIANTETLIIVPHHVLHYFPFAALVTETDTAERGPLEMPQATFLIDVLGSGSNLQSSTDDAAGKGQSVPAPGSALAYAPSLATWDMLRRETRTPVTQINAVGIVNFKTAPSLPGVEQDLANLKSVFNQHVNRLVEGADASESAVAGLLTEPGLLFVATHGMNVADQPLSSFLLCHADQSHDGHLTAGEIFMSSLSVDIVVMSACYSGLADRSPLPGDDLFGLQRAFLHSGVRTVVSGLWDVYDATGPMLMHDFFQHFAAGEPVAAALAGAQRDFLKAQRAEGPGNPWTHPYFWAVYTAAGNPQLTFSTNEKGD